MAMAFYVMVVEVAENFKNQGNDCFKQGKKFYKDALLFYTNGLEVFCKDDKLNETLYVNRAACNLHFGKDDGIFQSLMNFYFVTGCNRPMRSHFSSFTYAVF